ncbi:hypothetical protein GCM10011367_26200 [Marinicauda pacifica]|uniref:DUF2884 family protein n=1 Tax=Marinicauda pacifica TaxID=1133559 RepID=A0A4S2H7T4_9PROT|nr:hypothetical protein [Marinicauda pacifica]TGY91874.1 hypothetical protein E5162_13455 [Marinicauda pacifica]GGE50069.1 hypothetical protein GCM10011367_26200 [Marinicauda pacifica]
MKTLFLAAAAMPALMACASASADEARQARQAQSANVLTINGKPYVVESGADVASLISEVTQERGAGNSDFDFDFDIEFDNGDWTPRERAEFERAMEDLSASMASIGQDMIIVSEFDEERVRVHAAHIEEMAEAHAERIAARTEAIAAEAERMAEYAELRTGDIMDEALAAGLVGMEAGLLSMDAALERGWVEEDGERRTLTRREREELRTARAGLAEGIAEFRAEHRGRLADLDRRASEMRAREGDARSILINEGSGPQRRHIRVEDEDGQRRVWVNGRELEGDALEDFLDGFSYTHPAPPDAPRAPELEGGHR